MTSVAINTEKDLIAVAVQAEGLDDDGVIVLLNYDNEILATVKAGKQPDMVTFTKDGTKVLAANEGEPRDGYADGTVDPKGSVTVVDLSNGVEKAIATDVTFDAWDTKRDALVEAGIIIKKNTAPSVDLEPEYIAVNDAGTKAYVALQEANAIAVLDLTTNTYSGIYSVGFEDHSKAAIDIDKKDEKYESQTYESLRGIRMPDGISIVTIGGIDYLLTANEGDSRDWNGYLNEDERNFGKGKTSPTGAITAENSGLTGKVVFFDSSDYDGLDDNLDYLFGGRSFTMFQVSENGLKEVYTSGNDFEELTAQYVQDNFNCSNDDKTIDDRSGKKGPEPESVVAGQIGNKTYAFIGLERVGGVMVYDITNPAESSFVNYINSRDFSDDIAGDVSPEGLCFVPAGESVSGQPELFVAHEVSGTVGIYRMTQKTEQAPEEPGQNPGENPDQNSGQPSQNPDQNPDNSGDANTDKENAEGNNTQDKNITVNTDKKTNTQKTEKPVKTGDQSNGMLWIMFIVMSIVAAGGTVALKKRNVRK